MYKEINISLYPFQSVNEDYIKECIAGKLGVKKGNINQVKKLKKSIDARQKKVKVNLKLGVWIDEIPKKDFFRPCYKDVSKSSEVIIVGAGPAGLFAALRLIEKGIKPIIFERGKSVEERKKGLKELYKTGNINPNSNFGFGEGGAGTFSDGKLYTRSKKKGNINEILKILHFHGAQEDILWDSHPHIGSDILPRVIINIRKTILEYGGEVYFDSKVIDFLIEKNKIKGIVVEGGKEVKADSVILATGHSARNIYKKLIEKEIKLEFKNFAVGVRLEHSQHLIDCIQYHNKNGRGKYLPAAEYSFVGQFDGKGVYSFCMCPGGVIVPAATDTEQQVVNGMSSSGRNTPWANSAMVAEVSKEDLEEYIKYGELAGMYFQEDLEKKAWKEGGGRLYAPAQRMCDFVNNKKSESLPVTSYKPGVKSSDMHNWLPTFAVIRLQKAFRSFGKRARGFLTNEALILGVETRTSSPVRIPRDLGTFQHIETEGLYPCGEGAGYAGGIVSAAMDGMICVDKLIEKDV